MSFFKRLFGSNSTTSNQDPEEELSELGIDPEATVGVVRAYLVAIDPGYVIGLQREDEWYLPGGIVEGPGRPEDMPHGKHFEPLAWYLKEQTGMTLEGLSDGVGMGMFQSENGMELTVLYMGTASGTQTSGSRFELDSIPDLAGVCSVTADEIRKICSRV